MQGSPGANDNASAVSVTLDILRRARVERLNHIGIRGFFFDEEELAQVYSLYQTASEIDYKNNKNADKAEKFILLASTNTEEPFFVETWRSEGPLQELN